VSLPPANQNLDRNGGWGRVRFYPHRRGDDPHQLHEVTNGKGRIVSSSFYLFLLDKLDTRYR